MAGAPWGVFAFCGWSTGQGIAPRWMIAWEPATAFSQSAKLVRSPTTSRPLRSYWNRFFPASTRSNSTSSWVSPSSAWTYCERLPVPPVIVICIVVAFLILAQVVGEGFLGVGDARFDPAILVLVGRHRHQLELAAVHDLVQRLQMRGVDHPANADAATSKRSRVHARRGGAPETPR